MPCNSLYCVSGRLVQLICSYNTVDQTQKAVNDGFHKQHVNVVIIPLLFIASNSSFLHKGADMDLPCSLFLSVYESWSFRACSCPKVFDLRSLLKQPHHATPCKCLFHMTGSTSSVSGCFLPCHRSQALLCSSGSIREVIQLYSKEFMQTKNAETYLYTQVSIVTYSNQLNTISSVCVIRLTIYWAHEVFY